MLLVLFVLLGETRSGTTGQPMEFGTKPVSWRNNRDDNYACRKHLPDLTVPSPDCMCCHCSVFLGVETKASGHNVLSSSCTLKTRYKCYFVFSRCNFCHADGQERSSSPSAHPTDRLCHDATSATHMSGETCLLLHKQARRLKGGVRPSGLGVFSCFFVFFSTRVLGI